MTVAPPAPTAGCADRPPSVWPPEPQLVVGTGTAFFLPLSDDDDWEFPVRVFPEPVKDVGYAQQDVSISREYSGQGTRTSEAEADESCEGRA